MKPPPPPIVSMRYLAPGARVLNPHLIPAELVISTNSIGLKSLLAVCPGSCFANRPVTQIVKMSRAIRMVFILTVNLFTNRDEENICFQTSSWLQRLPSSENSLSSITPVKAKNVAGLNNRTAKTIGGELSNIGWQLHFF